MPCPYKFGVTSDNFGVGKRHCRVLHRPTGRWLNRIGRWLNRIGRWLNRIGRSIDFTHYPKFGDGSAVSLQIRGYIRSFWGVGKRHCRVLHRPTGRPCDRYYALPEIRKRHCRVLLNPQLPKFNSTILPTADESFAQKPDRHCRNRTRMSLQSVQQFPAKIPNSDRTVKTADSKIFPVRADCCC